MTRFKVKIETADGMDVRFVTVEYAGFRGDSIGMPTHAEATQILLRAASKHLGEEPFALPGRDMEARARALGTINQAASHVRAFERLVTGAP